jgi:hypothetical protein
MRHGATLLLTGALLAALPGGAVGQRALKAAQLEGAPHVSQRSQPIWTGQPTAPSYPPRNAAAPLTGLRSGINRPARLSWSGRDVVLASAFTAALLIDAGQTRGLARGGWHTFRETNPILGSRPSVGQVNAYTAVAGLSVLGAAAALPERLRPWLLGAALAVETFTIAGTMHQGIAIPFP